MSKNIVDSAVVRWNDGSYDVSRTCVMCQSSTCHIPVHNDNYKIKIVGVLDMVEEKQETLELEAMGLRSPDLQSELEQYAMAEDLSEDNDEAN